METALVLFIATSTAFTTKRRRENDSDCHEKTHDNDGSSGEIINSRRRSSFLIPTNFYKRYLLPWFIDTMCSSPIIHEQRLKVVPLAEKEVLEIGIGSGLNLPLYNPDKVTKIVGVDPDEGLWKKSERRRSECKIPVERIGLSGERIPLPDESFDSVVVTYTLCSIPDATAALCEVKRLLRPGGRVYFCEHGKAPEPRMVKLQKRIEPFSKWACGGCCPGKDIPLLLKEAGFVIEEMDQGYISRPSPFMYNYWGKAHVYYDKSK